MTASTRIDVVDRPAAPVTMAGARFVPPRLRKLPLGAVRPEGWLKGQLIRMAEGMVGRLPELSRFLGTDSGWLGGTDRGWEEAPYWLRGFYPLAVLTGDERHLAEARRWIEAVLASQDSDGYFGATFNKRVMGKAGRAMPDLWPHMVMIDALIQHQEATGDARVEPFLQRFFAFCRAIPDSEFLPRVSWDQWEHYDELFGDWKPRIQLKRAGDMIPHLLWLYERTGEAWLLDLARRFRRGIQPPMNEWLDSHGVHFAQRWRYPAQMFALTGDAEAVAQSEYWLCQHMAAWGQQPRGAFAADERIRSGKIDPRQAFETCAMVELAKSFHILGGLTGDPLYADRCEDVMLNHFPAAQTADLKGLRYLTASNMPVSDDFRQHDFFNKGRMLVFSPHIHRCCQHNVAMGWPWHAEHLWLQTADGGLAAWMYAGSTVETPADARRTDGPAVRLRCETDYPFSGRVAIRVESREAIGFPLYLRIPRWCRRFEVQAPEGASSLIEDGGGRFVRMDRTWRRDDAITVDMAMDVSLTRWPRNGGVTVDHGPLSYSVRIDEEWRRCGGTDEWPEWEALPKSPWNYGLVLDRDNPARSFAIRRKDALADQPWTVETAPIEILAQARRIPGWGLTDQTVDPLRQSPIYTDEPTETITLIPMGCARLRMAALPAVGDGPEARRWEDAL